MAIEKGLYAAPQGMEAEEAPDLEIEIVDPEMVTLDDGSVEITIIPDAEPTDMLPFNTNLANILDEGVLSEMADELVGHIDADVDSRKDWASNTRSAPNRGKARVVCTLQCWQKQPYASKQKPCPRRSLPLGL